MDNAKNNSNVNSHAYLRAKEKTQELKSFYFSLFFFIIVNSGLVYIWYEYSGTNFQWFWFPIIGWGLGLFFKAVKVYDFNFLFGNQWEQRQIQKYIKNENFSGHQDIKSGIIYQRAKKRVDSIKGFYSHLTVYLIVNTFIVATIVSTTNIDLFSFSAFSTPFFWGIGLLAHALGVFGENLFFGQDWEERKIKALMDSEYDEFK